MPESNCDEQKNHTTFFLLLAILVATIAVYSAFAATFDDERYVFKGQSEVSWDQAKGILDERPGIKVYDPDPLDDKVLLVYDFHLGRDDMPMPYSLGYLDYTVDRDPGAWAKFVIVTLTAMMFAGGSIVVLARRELKGYGDDSPK